MSSFTSKVAEAEQQITPDNIISPQDAKSFMAANSPFLLLDVQDPGSPSIPGAHQASLGTLFFKACCGMPDFKDPKIADLPKDHPIVVTCALGGQAKLGAKILLDYGFTNVKVIEGGCVAWNEAVAASQSADSRAPGRPRRQTTEEHLGAAKAKFDALDADSNGVLEGEELKALVGWVWEGMQGDDDEDPEEEFIKQQQADLLKSLMKKLDANKDGKLEFEEFSEWYRFVLREEGYVH